MELKASKQNLDVKNAEAKSQLTLFEAQQQELKRTQQHLRQFKDDNVRLTKENQIIQVHLSDLRAQLNDEVSNNKKLSSDFARRALDLKEKDDEINYLRKDSDSEHKKKDYAEKRLRLVEDQLTDSEQKRETLRANSSYLQQEIDRFQKHCDDLKTQIDGLTREREQLNKTCQKLIGDNQKQSDQMRSVDQSKRTLEQEISNYKDEAAKRRKILVQLEKERDR